MHIPKSVGSSDGITCDQSYAAFNMFNLMTALSWRWSFAVRVGSGEKVATALRLPCLAGGQFVVEVQRRMSATGKRRCLLVLGPCSLLSASSSRKSTIVKYPRNHIFTIESAVRLSTVADLRPEHAYSHSLSTHILVQSAVLR